MPLGRGAAWARGRGAGAVRRRAVLGWIAGGAAAAGAAGAAWVRLAPAGIADWHVDPSEGRMGPGRYLVAAGGDRAPLRSGAPPEAVVAALDRIAAETPRTRGIARTGGLVTYETRSRGFGFPDYTSIRVEPEGTGSVVTAYARLRYGKDDLGVNRARVEDWLARLEAAL